MPSTTALLVQADTIYFVLCVDEYTHTKSLNDICIKTNDQSSCTDVQFPS